MAHIDLHQDGLQSVQAEIVHITQRIAQDVMYTEKERQPDARTSVKEIAIARLEPKNITKVMHVFLAQERMDHALNLDSASL